MLALGVIVLFIWQDRLLWHPRPYARGDVENFSRPLVLLTFRTAQGQQTAFYAPPRDGRALPQSLWTLFAGNGSLALDWYGVLREQADPGAGFLLVDYPGYGRCKGASSPASIRDNADGALDALARQLGRADGPALERAVLAGSGGRLATVGQSMGTGVALAYAARHPPVSKVILVSPYTSLRDASRGTVGWPLCYLLRGNFDNRARLDELAARRPPPPVVIFHGDADTYVPPTMGRALAAAHPGQARFESVPGADHGNTVELALPRIVAELDAR